MINNNKFKNPIICYIDLFIGIIIFLYTIAINCISTSRIAFSGEFIAIGVALIVYHFVKRPIIKFVENHKKFSLAIRSVNVLIIIAIALLCIIEGFIIGYPKNNKSDAKYIIVLGAGLRDGDQISTTLKDRLDAAIDVMENDSYIVVSGGKGSDESISEAEAMEKYLIQCNVSKDRIIKEDKSTSTIENLMYSKQKIQDKTGEDINKTKIKIVTTDFHACRAAYIAEKNGYEGFTVYSSKSLYYLIPIYYVREALAMVKTVLLMI